MAGDNEPEEQEKDAEKVASYHKHNVKNDLNKKINDVSEKPTGESEYKLTENDKEKQFKDGKGDEKEKSAPETSEKEECELKSMKRVLPDSSLLNGTNTFETPFSSIAKKVTEDSFFSRIETNRSGKFEGSFESENDKPKGNQYTIVNTSAFGNDDVPLYEGKCAKIAVFKTGEIREWGQSTMTRFNIIRNEKSGVHRLVCFQTGTGRLQLNTEINDNMKIQKIRDKIIIFMGRDTKNQSILVPYKMSFPDKCSRDSFHDKLLSYSNGH
ncbi:conserved Plasmodium protein, unknown function [Babesia microti strain RI]|uniref:RanBD1 domain-containing protein n=1 Tax=Babesia microti (strain RI) TaxID=1133968 RepID=A0A1N6LY02_BABMR|nr:conserved Plasmodium protein, unknown function [Babesia microti strain RI]SIO73748.1 conserved Plasmodium protein, unknown function [Babesia microti strain RI]|eukprot:XP_021337811.1 conserved Plasmodium protein, unknown function [Babesia microti strain RI]